MAKSYLITGPLHVANKEPGDTVNSDELTDAAHLLAIGYITPISAKNAKRVVSGDAGVVESTLDFTTESNIVSTQENL
jgi:hypothetical protein